MFFGAVKNANHRFLQFDRPQMSYYTSQQLPHYQKVEPGNCFKGKLQVFVFLNESLTLLLSSVCIAGEPLSQVADTRTIYVCSGPD